MSEWIGGRNPVFEVLRAGRRQVEALRIAQGAKITGRLEEILSLSRQAGVSPAFVPREELDRLGQNHQGVVVRASEFPYATEFDLLNPESGSEAEIILILDAIQDPQNLGTLIRTAESVGVRGIILPLKRAASITPAVVQASSGASEHMNVVRSNLAAAIARLKESDYWVIGLENSDEAQLPGELRLDGRIALVVGSEGQGMRRLVRESCDFLMRLPIKGRVGSLNASVAGSIALYLVWAARGYGPSEISPPPSI